MNAKRRSRQGPPFRLPAVRKRVLLGSLADVKLTRTGDLLLAVLPKLEPLRHPARHARGREQAGQLRPQESHRLIQNARVEVDVRVETALREVWVGECDLLD